MAGVQIFRIELTDRASGAHLTLAGGREFNPQCFYLDFGDFTLRMHADQAARFASAVRRLAWRRRVKASGREATPGAVYRREVGDEVGPAIKIELGLGEDGRVYVVGGIKISCDETQTEDLLYFLGCFADDVAAIATASEPPPRPYSPSRDYRSRWLPVWN